jgi:hypothetical protein
LPVSLETDGKTFKSLLTNVELAWQAFEQSLRSLRRVFQGVSRPDRDEDLFTLFEDSPSTPPASDLKDEVFSIMPTHKPEKATGFKVLFRQLTLENLALYIGENTDQHAS